MKKTIAPIRFLFLLLLIVTTSAQGRAQTIDSFHLDHSASPHRLYVRMAFPDSTYYIERTIERVAYIYPPVNLLTLYYRSCTFVRANPKRDTTLLVYTPRPYGLRLWLASDTNTVTSDCTIVGTPQIADSVIYDSLRTPTGIAQPDMGTREVQLFPNPAKDVLTIAGEPGTDLLLYDGLGRLLLQRELRNNREMVDVSTLAPGLYYIRLYREGRILENFCFSKLP